MNKSRKELIRMIIRAAPSLIRAENACKKRLGELAFDKCTPTLELFKKVEEVNGRLITLCNLSAVDYAFRAELGEDYDILCGDGVILGDYDKVYRARECALKRCDEVLTRLGFDETKAEREFGFLHGLEKRAKRKKPISAPELSGARIIIQNYE